MTRTADIRGFLTSAGWENATVAALAGDASNRRYDRLTRPNGETAVLMDAPPEAGEDVQKFVHIAEYLQDLGLSAPGILYKNNEQGFLLIEDLGDRLFAKEVLADPSVEQPLYLNAADVLTRLHAAKPPALAAYNSATTVPLAALAFDWYQFGALGAVNEPDQEKFVCDFQKVISPFDKELTVLIQRDFHAENLLWLPDRSGPARVGLLDFQDAMLGHAAYDLVSILQDARRDVSADVVQSTKAHFVTHNNHDANEFDAAFAVFGLQRNLRILGGFSRLCMRAGKAQYVDLIPRVWGHIQTNLRHPAVRDVAPLIKNSLPAPTPEICDRIKSKCGLWTGR